MRTGGMGREVRSEEVLAGYLRHGKSCCDITINVYFGLHSPILAKAPKPL